MALKFPALNPQTSGIRIIRLHSHSSDLEPLKCSLEVVRLDDKQREAGVPHQVFGFSNKDSDLESWRQIWDNPGALSADGNMRPNAEESDTKNTPIDNRNYIALSYRWGDIKQTESIFINDLEVKIQKNLANALRSIRSKGEVTRGSCIWADLLCVDQQDVTDRNRHIAMMSDIYSKAVVVVVWLGEECDNSSLAIDTIYSLGKQSDKNGGTDNRKTAEALSTLSQFPSGSWLALYNFMGRDYWKRMWIIQELCLSNPSPILLCGQRALPWKCLYAAIWTSIYSRVSHVAALIALDHVQIHGTSFPKNYQPVLQRNFIFHVNTEQTLQSGHEESLRAKLAEGWHVMPMLDLGRSATATNDRDKIYGMFALLPSNVRSHFHPDYNLSIADCYTSFARAWIVAKADLEILSQCSLDRKSGLPSWVPDWRFKKHKRLFGGSRKPYKASLQSRAVVSMDDDDDSISKRLTVRGILVDEVNGLGHESMAGTECLSGTIQSHFDNNAYGSLQGLIDALWRTLQGNITTSGLLISEEFAEILNISLADNGKSKGTAKYSCWAHFQGFVDASKNLRMGGRPLRSFFPLANASVDSTSRSSHLGSALEQVYRVSKYRRIATTVHGRLAMVPDRTEPGDVVSILYGSGIPMVMRRVTKDGQDPVYEIVGGCYMHGIMNGEMLESGDQHSVDLCIVQGRWTSIRQAGNSMIYQTATMYISLLYRYS